MVLWWFIASALAADDTCEQIVSLALEAPKNHRPYVVFTQCQKNPPDFLANTSTRTCMEFARLFSLALHYNRKLVPKDFCSTTLSYQDSQFTVDPLIEDHEQCVKTVGGVFGAADVRGALRTACNEAKSSVVLDCDRYVSEIADSIADGVMDGSRLCDRVLTGRETIKFDPAHFLYTCVQYARHGDSAAEISRKCKTVANEEFCEGYVNLVSKGATQNEIKAYCLHQEVELHSPIVAAPLEPLATAGTQENTMNAEVEQAQAPPSSVLAPGAPTPLTPAGSGVPHIKLSANMFTMCENTIDKVSSPDFPSVESTVTDECAKQLGRTLLPEEMQLLGDRVLSGCNYFATKFLQARTRVDFSRQAFCHALTQDRGTHTPIPVDAGSPTTPGEQPQGQQQAAASGAPIVVAGEGDLNAVVQQTSGPLVQNPFGDGNSHTVGRFPREVQPIMVDTAAVAAGTNNKGIGFSQVEQRARASNKSTVLEAARPILRHSFVDTTPSSAVQEGEDALMNHFLDSYEVEQAKKNDVDKKAEKSFPTTKYDYSGVDATVNEFLKAYK
eukprot:GEMP01033959.1.p1 GENE.GEMP01033959.1~~GEMP01033959.1.p1  ORF type:complete len:556 (+),score=140.09 GEMP01033959.1:36-1703(+)